ncbi:hypothetical protein QC764_0065740 [Podospora pseudoanserina]|uniref:Uncharacterized protein n=1 Tax=Podospora pseudoanserina TaxID=2609844 RepID=A0ABR0I9R8_9PEZI|nr:hypothetical protein QC764_0065740 [Podospora pseudoanserina]
MKASFAWSSCSEPPATKRIITVPLTVPSTGERAELCGCYTRKRGASQPKHQTSESHGTEEPFSNLLLIQRSC